jgi:hypothetical protein
MTTICNIARDVAGTPLIMAGIQSYPDLVRYVTFVDGDPQTFYIPEDAANWIITFSYFYNSQVYVSVNTEVIVPFDIGVQVGSPLNPPGFRVKGGDQINLSSAITNGDLCTFSLYSLGT